MSEREAYALAQIINLMPEMPNETVEQAVIYALVSAKEAADGHTRRNQKRLKSVLHRLGLI